MRTEAREQLAEILGDEAPPTASSARLKADLGDLRLEVEGVGHVRLPVSAGQARQLCQLGRPARFGRGEDTLTDPKVRDTWEVPKGLVRVEWNGTLESILDNVRDQLGLPSHCRLAADLHSMLVYEQGQFFVAHQDSEKDDAMVGTLVVTLPSTHTGGELVIERGGQTTTYRGSKSALSLVAFYSDCRHEVRPVTSGHRITITYNLLLTGDTSGPVAGEDPAVSELARCLDQHFRTPVVNPYRRTEEEPPIRLVYLLDHEYTARGLSWSRLKGSDAGRVSLLRTAADSSGCEAVLALADIQETWSAYESAPRYGYRAWRDDYDDEDGESDSEEHELDELVNSSVRLTHWIGPAEAWSEDVSLSIDDAEVCATTRSADLPPYASEYEGYMGNYGNTMDRWYRRAALVVWPRDRHLTNRAEASPGWALDELRARARAGDLAAVRAATTTLAPFWDTAVRTQDHAKLFRKALPAASALDDAATAELLLRPFQVEGLRRTHGASLAKLAKQYGERWVGELLQTWFGDGRARGHAGRLDRPQWLSSLPGLCEALHAKGSPGTATAHRLLQLSWRWLGETIRDGLAAQSPRYRDMLVGDLGTPLAAVLTAAAATDAFALRDEVVGFCRQQGDEVLSCVMPALRAAEATAADIRRDGGFDDLAADCARRLRARLARPPRADDDWSIPLPAGCACELCDTLGAFLRDPARRSLEWPLAQQGRSHVHSRIDMAELPVRHETRRTGRPYTLVLTKRQELFARERRARMQDEEDLEWLTTTWHVTQP